MIIQAGNFKTNEFHVHTECGWLLDNKAMMMVERSSVYFEPLKF